MGREVMAAGRHGASDGLHDHRWPWPSTRSASQDEVGDPTAVDVDEVRAFAALDDERGLRAAARRCCSCLPAGRAARDARGRPGGGGNGAVERGSSASTSRLVSDREAHPGDHRHDIARGRGALRAVIDLLAEPQTTIRSATRRTCCMLWLMKMTPTLWRFSRSTNWRTISVCLTPRLPPARRAARSSGPRARRAMATAWRWPRRQRRHLRRGAGSDRPSRSKPSLTSRRMRALSITRMRPSGPGDSALD